MAIDIALPVVLGLMILLIGVCVVSLAVRSRSRQQHAGERGAERREERGDERF